MKRRTIALSLILIAALLLAGCGASAAPERSNSMTPSAAYDAEMPMENGWAYDEAETASYQAETETGSALPANVKMIYTANIALESTEFDAAVNALNALVAECGGWLENSSLSNYNSRYRSASYTVRVPAEQFETFCARAGETATLRSIDRSAEDVSEAYYDMESRLATQRTKLERLQTLLAQAENMEDIITLESAISDTELAIERLTGSLRHYDSLVGYSTVYVNLSEVYKVTEAETAPIGFGERLGRAFRNGTEGFVDGLGEFVIDLAEIWLGLLVFLIICAVIVFFIVRGAKKRARRREEQRRQMAEAAAQRTAMQGMPVPGPYPGPAPAPTPTVPGPDAVPTEDR